MSDEKKPDEQELRERLTPLAFKVCMRKGTEPPFSGEHLNTKGPGVFSCVCCDNPLFSSQAKFESGCGWPSFFSPLNRESVTSEIDDSLWTRRIEVLCRGCGAHLGHVFDDGPPPTGKRYCINSVCLTFEPLPE